MGSSRQDKKKEMRKKARNRDQKRRSLCENNERIRRVW